MPLYDFECQKCGASFEYHCPSSETPPCYFCESAAAIIRKFPAPRIGHKYGEMKKAEKKGERVRKQMRKDMESVQVSRPAQATYLKDKDKK